MSSANWSRIKQERNSPLQGNVLKTVEAESLNKVGSNTPNFMAKVRLGQQLPMNAYTRTHVQNIDWLVPGYSLYYATPTSKPVPGQSGLKFQWENFSSLVSETTFPISLANVQLAAQANFWENASKDRDDFGLMVAEGKKTASLVTTTAVRIATAYKRLRRLDVWGAYQALNMRFDNTGKALSKAARGVKNDFAHHSRFAASSFLEVQYGWKPLLSDVYTSAERLAERNKKQDFDIVIRGHAHEESPILYTTSPAATLPPASFRMVAFGNNSQQVGVTYVCRYRVVNPALRVASGLGLTNPLALAWELLPFSFVVDWFTPIGNFFESMSALQGLSYSGGVRSTKTNTDRSIAYFGRGLRSSSTGLQNVIQGAGRYERHTHSFTRVATVTPPRSGPFALNPRAMGSDRPLKALALLRSVIR